MTPVLGVFCYNLPYVVFSVLGFSWLEFFETGKNKPAITVWSIIVDPKISGKNKSIKV